LLIQLQVVTITTYGINDEFTGQRHAASWHGVTPNGAPETVDKSYMGAASNDFPFGTVLRVTSVAECNGDDQIRKSVEVTVVDRLATPFVGYVDLWPAAAEQLNMGKDDCALGYVEVIE